jgi:hypothetical protein
MLTKFTYLLSILVFGLIVFSASETLGQNTGLRRASIFKLPLVENEAADLDQCANGAVGGTPVQCTGAAWQNGNLNQNQAHYYEGESIAYRMRFSGLVAGSTNTVTIEWDTTENAKHALDYVTSFNQSETDAIPCSGVVGCVPADRHEFAIPLDPLVSAGHDGVPGTTDDITQIPGVFTLFGGTISGVSTYTTTGTFAGSSQTRITITFHADVVNPVLAWGGHISTRVKGA